MGRVEKGIMRQEKGGGEEWRSARRGRRKQCGGMELRGERWKEDQ